MALTIKEVEHVAKLSRLALTENEKKAFTNQLEKILGYIDKLNEVNTDNIELNKNILDNKENVLREDIRKQSFTNEEILANAPDQENGFFKVKKVIE